MGSRSSGPRSFVLCALRRARRGVSGKLNTSASRRCGCAPRPCTRRARSGSGRSRRCPRTAAVACCRPCPSSAIRAGGCALPPRHKTNVRQAGEVFSLAATAPRVQQDSGRRAGQRTEAAEVRDVDLGPPEGGGALRHKCRNAAAGRVCRYDGSANRVGFRLRLAHAGVLVVRRRGGGTGEPGQRRRGAQLGLR